MACSSSERTLFNDSGSSQSNLEKPGGEKIRIGAKPSHRILSRLTGHVEATISGRRVHIPASGHGPRGGTGRGSACSSGAQSGKCLSQEVVRHGRHFGEGVSAWEIRALQVEAWTPCKMSFSVCHSRRSAEPVAAKRAAGADATSETKRRSHAAAIQNLILQPTCSQLYFFQRSNNVTRMYSCERDPCGQINYRNPVLIAAGTNAKMVSSGELSSIVDQAVMPNAERRSRALC